MDFTFRTKKLKKICEKKKELKRKYGLRQAEKIVQRINQIEAAVSLYDIKCIPDARLHPLGGKRKQQFSVDLVHPYRLILFPLNGDVNDFKTINSVKILEIVDYH